MTVSIKREQKVGLFAVGLFIGIEAWLASAGDIRTAVAGAAVFFISLLFGLGVR